MNQATSLRRSLLALVVLAIAIAALHGPGLRAAPSWDLTQYFVERQSWPTFSEALHRLDYPLARRYWKGDEGQFRPLLMLQLAVQYQLFGVDVRRWGAVSLALHIAVAFLLYRLLAARLPQSVALSLAVLFAVMYASAGLVLFPWVGGYLTGSALFLIALENAWERRWLPYAICMSLAGFFFEVFVVFSLFLAAWFRAMERREGRPVPVLVRLGWMLPAAAFAALYVPRLFIVPRLFYVDDIENRHLLASQHLITYVVRVFEYLFRWSVSTTLPAVRPFFPVYFEVPVPPRPVWVLALAVNVALIAGILGLVSRHWRVGPSSDARSRLLMTAGLVLVYTAVIRFGRNVTDETHWYIFALLFVVAFATAIERAVLVARARTTLVALIVALAGLNASAATGWIRQRGNAGAEYASYLSALDDFVRTHKGESGFSFHVEATPAVMRPVKLLEGYPDSPTSVTDCYFWETFPGAVKDPADAAYHVVWDGNELLIQSTRGR